MCDPFLLLLLFLFWKPFSGLRSLWGHILSPSDFIYLLTHAGCLYLFIETKWDWLDWQNFRGFKGFTASRRAKLETTSKDDNKYYIAVNFNCDIKKYVIRFYIHFIFYDWKLSKNYHIVFLHKNDHIVNGGPQI